MDESHHVDDLCALDEFPMSLPAVLSQRLLKFARF